MNEDVKPDPEQKKVLRLYAAFGAALVLCLVPFFLAALLSMGLFIGVLIAAYIIRTDAPQGSLIENHMTYVIRTIWIGSFLSLIALAAGSVYLFFNVNNQPLDPCIQHFLSMRANPNIIDMMAVVATFKSCMLGYTMANFKVFLISFIGVAAPIVIYFLVRFARGLSRALSGYRVNKPLGWF